MTYVSWAAVWEGNADRAYFEVLIPRVMEDLIMTRGTRNSTIPPAPAITLRRGSAEDVAAVACAAKDAFAIIFVHADTGGRALESDLNRRTLEYCEAMHRRCQFPRPRCVAVTPRHETEAWVLADPAAIMAALGYSGPLTGTGLPTDAAEAEALNDPKATLNAAVRRIRGPRARPPAPGQVFAAIAQRQSLESLRRARSFSGFETAVATALKDLGCLR